MWARCEPSKQRLAQWREAGGDPADRPKPFFKLETVFDRAQVDPLPPPAEPAPLDPPIAPIEGDSLSWAMAPLASLAAELGVGVALEPLAAGHDGSYRPDDRVITICTAISTNQQVAALCHELAHALVRLDRQEADPTLGYAAEELVAESVAFTVCGSLGLDTSGNSVPYMAVWAHEADGDAFMVIASLVDRLARRLEDSMDESRTDRSRNCDG